MVRVKRPTGSKTSQRVNKDNNPSIRFTGVHSEVDKHGKGTTHSSCNNINQDLEERCSEYCSSLSTSDDYPVAGVDISKDIATDQLNKPCDGETNIISSHLNSTTFNNFVMDMKLNSSKRIVCRRKGSLSIEEPLKTYYRKRKGFLRSLKPLKTYCRRRSGYLSLGISPLLIQNSVEIKVEDIDLVHPVQKTMHCVDINTCQKQMTATDRESSNTAVDMVLEKDRKGQSRVNHLAAGSEDSRSPVLPGSTCVMFTEEISDVATQEHSMELDMSEKPDIIVDETCDVLFAGNNLNKSTNDIKNGVSLVERKQDNIEEPSLVSSETMKQHIITQSRTAASKMSPQGALSGSIKRKLLVLDINGLLADIVSAEHVSHENGPVPDTIIARKGVFKRPFCDEFLEFCFERFNVGVWSSRTKKNVDSVLNFLMGEKRQNLLFCWDQSQCTCTRYYTPENEDKPLFFKKVNKLWENFGNDLPWKRGDYDESNTLLLDDSPYKALLNPPNTAIFPCTYQFRDEKDNALGPDGDLRIYLEGLSMALNVQEYVKQNPYGQYPITENHASWSFYHEVIESTMVGSLKNPTQSLVSSEKLWKDVFQVNSISVAESSKECLDNNGTFQQLEIAEPNRQVMEIADDNPTGSPTSIRRGCKRGRGTRSQSPRHEISGNQCHSLSPKKCRRSKSPAPSHGSDFGGDKGRSYQILHSECRNFSQGRCLRGTSCRFVHHQSHHKSYADRRVRQHESQIFEHKPVPRECYAFIRGKCDQGASCTFLHSVPDKANLCTEGNGTDGKQLDNVRSYKPAPRECYDFIQGKCNWGASCRFLHSEPRKADLGSEKNEIHGKQLDTIRRDKVVPQECNDFMRGKCNRGASCRYLHSVPDKTDRLNSFHYRHYQDVHLSSKISGDSGKAQSSSFNEYGRYKALPEICRNYTQGRCYRESYCPYLHQESGVTVGSGSTSQLGDTGRYKAVREVCWDYLQGRCHKGPDCLYLHQEPGLTTGSLSTSQHRDMSRYKAMREVCRNYTQGRCHKGSDCQYMHQEPDLTGLGSTSQVGETRRFNAVNEVCRNHTQGRCYKGLECRYLHQEPGLAFGPGCTAQYGQTSRYKALPEVCRNYIQGRCQRGSDCPYLHRESGGVTAGSGSISETRRFKALQEVCRNYTRGRCHKGLDCQYLHQEPGYCRSPQQSFSHQSATSSWNTKLLPRQCADYTRGKCWRGVHCRFMHHEDVSSNPKSFGSCGDSESIHHETSVHEHTDSRTQESIPQFSGVDEKGGTVEVLPNQPTDGECSRETSIVPDDDAKYIKHLENGVSVFMGNLGDSDQMKLDVNNSCHERSVHETAERGTNELIPDFPVIEEQRGIVEPRASHPIYSDSSGKASVVPKVDTQDGRVPENVVCAPSTDNLGHSDRMVQDSDNQLEQMSNI